MSLTDDLLANNDRYAASFTLGDLASPPTRHLAVITCMDARIDAHALLGLKIGEAHVIRNAGGVVTDDELRSIAISQRYLGTTEVMLIHHTGCGMQTFTDQEFAEQCFADTGSRPTWSAQAFSDLDADVRKGVDLIKAEPAIPHKDQVRGFVYDVKTGRLREVV